MDLKNQEELISKWMFYPLLRALSHPSSTPINASIEEV
jgi:hypothetical protein